ncbi:MAG: GDYXXLXY domain-containing protein [Candidatus Sumerlaeota bacterium]|nr:GDYXXLXY domain-containing protein [Candidatus Sumerlaeota bacterium]
MTRYRLAAIWVVAQALFLLGWACREDARLHEGKSILMRTVPVDPRDLLRGQYLALAYEFSRPSANMRESMSQGYTGPVWVVLRPDGEFYAPKDYFFNEPSGVASDAVVMKGTVENSWRIRFGVEQFDVPEGTPTPEQKDISVRLRVGGDGRAAIEQVLVKGQLWP